MKNESALTDDCLLGAHTMERGNGIASVFNDSFRVNIKHFMMKEQEEEKKNKNKHPINGEKEHFI